jgi:hypothetical protein
VSEQSEQVKALLDAAAKEYAEEEVCGVCGGGAESGLGHMIGGVGDGTICAACVGDEVVRDLFPVNVEAPRPRLVIADDDGVPVASSAIRWLRRTPFGLHGSAWWFELTDGREFGFLWESEGDSLPSATL